MTLAEMITYSTVLIRCDYSNGTSGSGTGFIINMCHDKENSTCVPVLITNNHVVENSVKTVFEFCQADENGNPLDIRRVSQLSAKSARSASAALGIKSSPKAP